MLCERPSSSLAPRSTTTYRRILPQARNLKASLIRGLYTQVFFFDIRFVGSCFGTGGVGCPSLGSGTNERDGNSIAGYGDLALNTVAKSRAAAYRIDAPLT